MKPEEQVAALKNAPADGWIAFPSDETQVVAYGVTYEDAVAKAEQNGELDPLLVKIPSDWTELAL